MPLKNYKKVKAEAKKYQQALNRSVDRTGKKPPFVSDELVEKNLKNEALIAKYERAKKFEEDIQRMVDYKNAYRYKHFGLAKENGIALDRCFVYFMDKSGTEEADRYNDELLEKYFDPSRRGEVVQMAFDKIRNFNYGEAFKMFGDFDARLDFYYEHYQEIEALFLIDNILTNSKSTGLKLSADLNELKKYNVFAETFNILKNPHFFYAFEGCFTYDYDKEPNLETEMKYMNVPLDPSQPGRKEFNGIRVNETFILENDLKIAEKFPECHNIFEYQLQNKDTKEIVDFNVGLNDPNCIPVKMPKELFDLYNSSEVIPVETINPTSNSRIAIQTMNQYNTSNKERKYIEEALESCFLGFESCVHNHMKMDPSEPGYEKDQMVLNEYASYLKDEFKISDTMIQYVMDEKNLSKPLLVSDIKAKCKVCVDQIMKDKQKPKVKANEVDNFLKQVNNNKPLSKMDIYFLEIMQDRCMNLKEQSKTTKMEPQSVRLIKRYDNLIARTDEATRQKNYNQALKNAIYTRANAINEYDNISGASRFFSHFVPNSWTKAGRMRNQIASFDKSFEKNGFPKEKVEELFDEFVRQDNLEVDEFETEKDDRIKINIEDPMKEEVVTENVEEKQESLNKSNLIEEVNDDLNL